ncbi:hypothetical protein ABK040_002146 [Willaertia magna]
MKRKYNLGDETAITLRKDNQQEDNTQITLKKQKPTSLVQANDLPPRTSSLPSPIVKLEGHQSEIYICKFSSSGNLLASGGFDKYIYLWEIPNNGVDLPINSAILKGHSNAVLDIDHFPLSENKLISCSADQTVILWDLQKMKKIRTFKEHSEIVNSCHANLKNSNLFISGGDDSNIYFYDQREKNVIKKLKMKYPIFSLQFLDEDFLFVSGIDHSIPCYDLKMDKIIYQLNNGHVDSITDIKLSNDSNFLLSTSWDNTCRIWDVRPVTFSNNRCVKALIQPNSSQTTILEKKTLLKSSWYKRNDTFGNANQFIANGYENDVMIWNTTNRELIYQLPGHLGIVNCVDFHPKEPIIASCSADKSIYLGEVDLKSY